MPDAPLLVYFSSVSENTHRFVGKIGFPKKRIPLPPKEAPPRVEEKYTLIMPTVLTRKL